MCDSLIFRSVSALGCFPLFDSLGFRRVSALWRLPWNGLSVPLFALLVFRLCSAASHGMGGRHLFSIRWVPYAFQRLGVPLTYHILRQRRCRTRCVGLSRHDSLSARFPNRTPAVWFLHDFVLDVLPAILFDSVVEVRIVLVPFFRRYSGFFPVIPIYTFPLGVVCL